MGVDGRLGGGVDHRSHVGARISRIADDQLVHGAGEHGQGPFGDILVQAEQAQGRTALSGGEEGRGDHVGDHLFGQGGGIDDHGVDPAGLGDQRRQRPGLVLQQGAGDAPGAGRRTGEGDAGHLGIGDQGGADRRAAGREAQDVGRYAGLVGQTHGGGGDQRGLRRGLGDHGVADGERGGDLAQEDRQREVPGADAGEDAPAGQAERIALAGRARQGDRLACRRA